VNLDKFINAQSYMISNEETDLFVRGVRYKGFDLLYPLLMQSSDSAASMLSAFLGEGLTVDQMNKKARALGMGKTFFADRAQNFLFATTRANSYFSTLT